MNRTPFEGMLSNSRTEPQQIIPPEASQPPRATVHRKPSYGEVSSYLVDTPPVVLHVTSETPQASQQHQARNLAQRLTKVLEGGVVLSRGEARIAAGLSGLLFATTAVLGYQALTEHHNSANASMASTVTPGHTGTSKQSQRPSSRSASAASIAPAPTASPSPNPSETTVAPVVPPVAENTITSANTGKGTQFRLIDFNIETIKQSQGQTMANQSGRITHDLQLMWSLHPDVIGLSEVEDPPLFRAVHQFFTSRGYTVYPDNPAAVYPNGAAAVPIILGPRYKIVSTDEVTFNRMDGQIQPSHSSILLVQDKSTGQEFYLGNTHLSPYKSGDYQRYIASLAFANKYRALSKRNVPAYLVGDFNNGTYAVQGGPNTTWQNKSANTTYDLLTCDGLMSDATDLLPAQVAGSTPTADCPQSKVHPTQPALDFIDRVYLRGARVLHYEVIPNKDTGSDHPLVYVDTKIDKQ